MWSVLHTSVAVFGFNKVFLICNNALTTEQLGRATSKITLDILLVRPEAYVNDVTNINLIDNKANTKGTCNKDDINIAVFPGVLRSSRHYLVRAQNQGHHAIDRLEERGVERGSAR